MNRRIFGTGATLLAAGFLGVSGALCWTCAKVRAFELKHGGDVFANLSKEECDRRVQLAIAAAQGAKLYVVEEDDDLVSIAIQHGVPPTKILELNNFSDEDEIKPGRTILLPQSAKRPASAAGKWKNAKAVAAAPGELSVVDVEYDGCDVLRVRLNERPSMDRIRKFVKVEPLNAGTISVRYDTPYRSDGMASMLVISGDFAFRTNVTLRVEQGLAAYDAKNCRPLAKTFTKTLRRNDLEPRISFADKGRYLPPSGGRLVVLESVNVTNVLTEIRSVPGANVVPLLALEEDALRHVRASKWIGEDEFIEDLSELVATGVLACARRPNVVERLPLRLRGRDGRAANGIYLASALSGDRPRRECRPYCWDEDQSPRNWPEFRLVCVTDVGITARRSAGGQVHVWTTSLSTGAPLSDVRVRVYSSANVLVAEGHADAHGWCACRRVAPGEPFAVVAERDGGDDAAFIALRDSMEVDETLEGGSLPRYLADDDCEAFVWTERGIYRHGEKILLRAILRNGRGVAPKPFPVELQLMNPSGDVCAKASVVPDANGTFAYEGFSVAADQPSGEWTVEVCTPGEKGVFLGVRNVKVEEFAPPQIRVVVESCGDGSPTNFAFSVGAEQLYGGPARRLRCEGAVVFEDVPFAPKGWEGYFFGDEDRGLKPCFRRLGKTRLDDAGRCRFEAPLWADSGLPRAAVRATGQGTVFEDGGRPATARTSEILHLYPYYLGATLGSWERIPAQGGVKFRLAAVAPDGRRFAAARRLTVSLDRVETVFAYRTGGNGGTWDCEKVRTPVDLDLSVELTPNGDAEVELPVREPGDWVVRVRDPETKVAWGRAFYAGLDADCEVRTSLANPTAVSVRPDRSFYRPGDRPRLLVKAPFAGTALVTVFRDKLVHAETMALTNATAEVVLPAAVAAWAPNVDVQISVVQGAAANGKRLAMRAHGRALVSVRRPENELAVGVEARVEGSTVVAEVTAPGAAFATVALVDEGINLLTSEPTPDPIGFFALPHVAEHPLFDVFHRILPAAGEDALRANGVKTGGGFGAELLGRVSPQPTRRFKPLALWRAQVPVVDGRARVGFDLPEFAGEVRVTALAWSAQATGAASVRRRVAPKLVSRPDAPRFAAPGDEFLAVLPLANRSGASGRVEWAVTLREEGGAGSGRPLGAGAFELPDGGSTNVFVPAVAPARPGEVHLEFVAAGLGERHAQTIALPVRPAAPWREAAGVVELAPGGEWSFPAAGPFARRSARVSGSRIGELSAALRWLADYPHGCLEQTCSRIFPLVAAGGALNGEGVAVVTNRTAYVEAGVRRVESMVRASDFVAWPDCGVPPWNREVSVFACHFLVAAERSGVRISPPAKAQSRRFLKLWAADRANTNAAVYACAVLALAGEPDVDRMLALDARRAALSPLSRARLALAFAAAKNVPRARALLADAPTPEGVKEAAFLLLALMETEPEDPRSPGLVKFLESRRDRRKCSWGTTEENSHALIALGEWYRRHPPAAGRPDVKFDAAHTTARNAGEGTAYITWRQLDLPATAETTNEMGVIALRRRFLTPEGEPADLANLTCGDLLVAELAVSSTVARVYTDLVVEDLFAGALEPVLSPLDPENFPWHKPAEHDWVMRADARDDRMLVFSRKFALKAGEEAVYHYPLRVVTPGSFVLPGASVEAMYAPEICARCASGRVTARPE